MIKLAVFDLDGTLCDTIEDLADAVNFALSTLGYPTHTPNEYKRMVGHGIPNLVFRALPEDKREDELVEKARDLMLSFYKVHFIDKTHAYDGINDLLLKLKEDGIHIAVCTNKAHNMATKVIEKIFPNTFDIVIGKSDDRPLKPDPYSVNEIMNRYGVSRAVGHIGKPSVKGGVVGGGAEKGHNTVKNNNKRNPYCCRRNNAWENRVYNIKSDKNKTKN